MAPRAALSFVTTCKSRLHHLRQTLPALVANEGSQVIVVDYGCPDGTGDWVAASFPSVVLVRAADDPGFNVSRARNLGAAASQSPWLFFVDADVRVDPSFVRWADAGLRPQHFFVRARQGNAADAGTWGSFLCTREAFEATGGFDEVMRGWGGEDDDMMLRLLRIGQQRAEYPAHLVTGIDHPDAERVTHYAIKDRELSSIIHRYYRRAKLKAMEVLGAHADLPLATRQRLYASIEEAFRPLIAGQTTLWPRMQFDVDPAEGLILTEVVYVPRPSRGAERG